MVQQILTIESRNPATGELLGVVPVADREKVNLAVETAKEAQKSWGGLSFSERAEHIQNIKHAIIARSEELIDILVKETGKPRLEALLLDIQFALQDLEYYSKNTEKQLQDEKVRLGPEYMGINSKIVFDPAGVIGIILPWNFPISLCTKIMIPALMAGNTVVIKPSEHTPLCNLKLQEVMVDAGLPENLVQVVVGGNKTGQYLVESDVDRVVLTGSVATGKQVMRTAAQKLHPVVLELGGKNPAIVCSDADIDLAANGILWGACINAGQVCADIERVYVLEDVADEFIEKIVNKAKMLRVGNGMDPNTDVGPQIAEFRIEIIERHVFDAMSKGAKILIGGKVRDDLGPLFFPPTVLVDVDHGMSIMREETFGPIIGVMRVDSIDEAVEYANDTDYGLVAYVWTRDVNLANGIARRLKVGQVLVNNRAEAPSQPFGGVKNSGVGRTGSRYGLLNYVDIKCITVDLRNHKGEDWWYPYSENKITHFMDILSHYFSDSFLDKGRAALKLFRGLRDTE